MLLVCEALSYKCMRPYATSVNATGSGDDYNDFNTAYGAGQTFKLSSGYTLTPNDYRPIGYTSPQPSIALPNTIGMVKPRRGMAIDEVSGLELLVHEALSYKCMRPGPLLYAASKY